MESATTIDEKIQEDILKEESKIVEALEEYYERFDTERSITYNGAARKRGVNPVLVVYFFREGIGVPDNKEDAEIYLRNLREYKKSRSL